MNEIDLIINYLSRYYRVNENQFFNIENDRKEYGNKIVTRLMTIFSFDVDICTSTLIAWAINLGLTQKQIDDCWAVVNPIGATYEPKKKNRFIVTFPSHYNIQQWVIKEACRPMMFFEVKKFLGIQYSKKIKWKPMTFILNDPIGPSTSQSLIIMARDYLTTPFNINIEMLDPTGVVVEKWDIINATIDSIDFGVLDVSLDELATCKLTVNVPEVIQRF